MKKNITINMCGRLYAIDEDAYELLSHYTDTLRNYFRKQEGGDEIANDIEERIAELFDELKAQGNAAITIEHVQEIIHRVGEVKDFVSDDDTASSESASTGASAGKEGEAFSSKAMADEALKSFDKKFSEWWNGLKGKKFYRSTDDKVLAGVLGGCAQFFGGNALVWRICFVIIALGGFNFMYGIQKLLHFQFFAFDFAPVALYILVAIFAPVALTPEERLKMKGKEVNPRNLASEVTESSKVANEQPTPVKNAKGCLAQFFYVIGKMLIVMCVVACLLLFIPGMVFMGMFIAYLVAPEMVISNVISNGAVSDFLACPEVLWGLAFSAMATCFVPAYCALHSVLNLMKKVQPMGFMQRVVWVAIWIIAVAGIVASSVKTADIVRNAHNAHADEYRFEYDEDGVTVEPDTVAADTALFVNENVAVKEHASESKVDTIQSISMRAVRRYAREHHMPIQRAEIELLKQRRRNGVK